MRRMCGKRLGALLLVLCLLATAGSALAAPEPITPYFLRIRNIKADLSINSGVADCFGQVQLSNSSDSALLTMALKQRVGTLWQDYEVWSISGSSLLELDESIAVPSGYDYHVVVSVTVYNSLGAQLETASATSRTLYY